ncbi:MULTISPECIES: helix-turn-helix domain-containing protein [unclassified Rhizobium]|jgi:HTH-type transcriptional regulator/antitoxin HigA|uniref:helix-turn-helix domain-containing protein n=1 Tax=unclassified Rhizobium TaxID=2613769 RepID=UPI000DD869D4|nr:helix-turn-helix domain-containing protein [Rhizobium sp. UBA1881]
MSAIRPIRNDADLAWATAEIEPYFDNPPAAGTPEADRFDILADLIEAYENRNFPVLDLPPIDFLQAFMEMTGRDQADLADVLGSRSRASEILNRKRALTVEMIFKLNQAWGVPSENLARPYALAVA